MGRKGNDKVYALVDDLVNIGTVELGTIGITLEKAQDAMRNIANALCFRYARTILYVPANLELQLGRRDEQIYQQHGQDGPDGARKYSAQRVAQLAEEHKLTTVHVYAIIKLMTRRETARRQGHLFGDDSGTAQVPDPQAPVAEASGPDR